MKRTSEWNVNTINTSVCMYSSLFVQDLHTYMSMTFHYCWFQICDCWPVYHLWNNLHDADSTCNIWKLCSIQDTYVHLSRGNVYTSVMKAFLFDLQHSNGKWRKQHLHTIPRDSSVARTHDHGVLALALAAHGLSPMLGLRLYVSSRTQGRSSRSRETLQECMVVPGS